MSETNPLIFAQITDIHIGHYFNPQEAASNLRWALREIGQIEPQPACILATADLVSGGTEAELEEYARLAADSPVPIYALPANHDLWGEQDTGAWERLVGPLRCSVDLPGLRVVLVDDVSRRCDQPVHNNEGWGAWLSPEKMAWVDEQLSTAPAAKLVAQHVPILPIADSFHNAWADSNASEVLDLYRRHNIAALITGHWHRNNEWKVAGVRIINTGALCGWQYDGIPPHHCFPTRPGYRLFAYDNEALRTFWRDGSYWTSPPSFPDPQVTLEWIGPVHTGGPRPQVQPVEVYANCTLVAKAFSVETEIAEVAWSAVRGQWQRATLAYQGLWSEWKVELDMDRLRGMGEQTLWVRATRADGQIAYDAVPIRLAECAASARRADGVVATALSERLFAPFYGPE